MHRLFLLLLCILPFHPSWAQPAPCEVDAMTSTCLDACVVCDIDGFTGRNNLTIQGQTFPGFCTTIFHNMSYIAFIAGTENLTLNVSVSNCTINRGIEVGIFESLDCQTFTPVTDCNTSVAPNQTTTFSNLVPLVIGQHYYLIMDGSAGDICDWTFDVVSGSTVVGDLNTSGIIEGPLENCPELLTTYTTTAEVGATMFNWTLNGVAQNDLNPTIDITFPTDGNYELCVTASNVCDQAPPSCTTITVSSATTYLVETLCANDCMAVAGESVCESGLYEFVLPLPNGCDSTIFLDLIILPEISSSIDINLCTGETFAIGDNVYSTSGVFVATIPNDAGCDSTVTLDLTMIDCELTGTIGFTTPICHGDENGTLLFSVDNGIPPFTYDWNNISVSNIGGTGNTTLGATVVVENIPAGIYEINITDSFGDDIVFIQEVVDPPVLSTTIEATDYQGYHLSCHAADDGAVTVSGQGGVSPYSFLWNNNATQATLVDLAAGTYEVVLTDANGCTAPAALTLIEPDVLEATVNFIPPNCEGPETGIIQLEAITGGTMPYTYALDQSPYSEASTFPNLGAGTYTFAVVDANGCSVDTSAILVAPDIPILYLEEDQEVDLGCQVSIAAYTNNTSLIDISWTNPNNSLSCDSCLVTEAAPVNDTEYVLTVTSVDNCTASEAISVQVNKIRDVYIPNAFSPNGDGINDYFFIHANKSVSVIKTFRVFNRWGALMYEKTDLVPNQIASGWDGDFKGVAMENGVYAWMAEVEYLDGVTTVLSGDISIIK